MAYYNNLSDEEIQDLKELFSSFDPNHTGTITTKNLESAIQSRGFDINQEELQCFINEADPEGKGTLDFADFQNIMAAISHSQRHYFNPEEEIIEACKAFDKDSKGLISKEELKQAIMKIEEKVTEEEVEELLKEADVDENGKVDYEGFVRMMMAK